MEAFFQYTINGLAVGGVYALVAIGFVIIYRVVRVVNIAQGDFLAVGALVFLGLATHGLPVALALLGGLVATLLVSLVVERLAVVPGQHAELRAFMLTLGASQLIQGGVLLTFGSDFLSLPTNPRLVVAVGGLHVNLIYVFVTLLVVVVLVALVLLMSRTRWGWAMLATADDPLAARLCAIPVRTMGIVAFALSAVVAGIGGALYGTVSVGTWDVGTTLATSGFVGAVIGGMVNPVRAAIGGFALGLLREYVSGYGASYWQEPMTFLFLIALLLVAPNLAKRHARRRLAEAIPA
ncbi:MAG: high-affinity branched-chain amino acid transport system permease [Candidatus Eremiobacteraeota bacterium]|nr:high-affinity branched-chain amino acid transport system permease [Candidatus Eremiobacteraeota bacterium]